MRYGGGLRQGLPDEGQHTPGHEAVTQQDARKVENLVAQDQLVGVTLCAPATEQGQGETDDEKHDGNSLAVEHSRPLLEGPLVLNLRKWSHVLAILFDRLKDLTRKCWRLQVIW